MNAAIIATQDLAATGSFNTQALDNTTIEDRKTYIRSEFAGGENITVARTFSDKNG